MKYSLYILIAILIFSFLSIRESKASTTSTNNNHTTVHIESNGQVQDYNSDTGGDVNMQSSDGHATVRITNNANAAVTVLPTLTSVPTITSSITPTIAEDKGNLQEQIKGMQEEKKHMQTEKQNIFQRILSFFISLFSHH